MQKSGCRTLSLGIFFFKNWLSRADLGILENGLRALTLDIFKKFQAFWL